MSASRMLSALALVSLCSCASIVDDEHPLVTITSPVEGARVSVEDERGLVTYTGTTPATVPLDRDDGYFDGMTYVVEVTAPGYAPGVRQIEPELNNWYLFGNLVFGGLIGYFIVDPLTGAMWTYDDGLVYVDMVEVGS